MRKSERQAFDRALEQLERLTIQWADERRAERDFIEKLQAEHAREIERLVGFITSPDQALFYSRARDLEQADDFVRKTGGGEFDELPVGQSEARQRFIRSELDARGISDAEIAAASGT